MLKFGVWCLEFSVQGSELESEIAHMESNTELKQLAKKLQPDAEPKL
jgi:hypothetical protein